MACLSLSICFVSPESSATCKKEAAKVGKMKEASGTSEIYALNQTLVSVHVEVTPWIYIFVLYECVISIGQGEDENDAKEATH